MYMYILYNPTCNTDIWNMYSIKNDPAFPYITYQNENVYNFQMNWYIFRNNLSSTCTHLY